MIQAGTILRIVSYTTASLILLVGFGVLTGLLFPRPLGENNFQIILGIMMMVYGSYRIIILVIKHRNERKENENIY